MQGRYIRVRLYVQYVVLGPDEKDVNKFFFVEE